MNEPVRIVGYYLNLTGRFDVDEINSYRVEVHSVTGIQIKSKLPSIVVVIDVLVWAIDPAVGLGERGILLNDCNVSKRSAGPGFRDRLGLDPDLPHLDCREP